MYVQRRAISLNVSLSALVVQIRKFLDGIYVSEKTTVDEVEL
jgi:hypothetical protein